MDKNHDKPERLLSLAAAIRSYFAEIPEAAAVYLFGSVASGRERPGSDIDIAVLFGEGSPALLEKISGQAYLQLSRLLKHDVHLVTLDTASTELVRQVLSKGRCILNARPQLHMDFKTRKIAEIADYGYYRDMFQRAVIARIGGKMLPAPESAPPGPRHG